MALPEENDKGTPEKSDKDTQVVKRELNDGLPPRPGKSPSPQPPKRESGDKEK